MATKRICDRCGAEINPPSSVTYAGIRKNINDNEYELCVSCANKLREWLNCPSCGAKMDGGDNDATC